jgi:hypothetical protein
VEFYCTYTVFMEIPWVRILLLVVGTYVNGTEQKKCAVFYGMGVRICKNVTVAGLYAGIYIE